MKKGSVVKSFDVLLSPYNPFDISVAKRLHMQHKCETINNVHQHSHELKDKDKK